MATKLPLAGGTMTGGLVVTAGNGDQLQLNNAGERFTQIGLQHSGTQNGALWLDDTDSMVDLYANTSHGIRLKTGGDNPRVTILSGGNVGIGDTSPSVKLDVYQSVVGIGVVDFRHVNGNRILLNPSYNYHDAYNHIFRGLNGTDTHMTIDNSGHVGIGTTSPTSYAGDADNLVIYSAAETGMTIVSGTASTGDIYFADGTGAQNRGFLQYHHADDSLRFGTAATIRMRIDSSGRVGINRTPTIANSKLEVGGADNVSLINVEASGVTGGMGIGSTGLQFFHGSSSKMTIDSSGNVVIGTSSAYSGAKLSVAGSAVLANGNQFVIGTFGTSGLQLIGTAGGDNIVGTMGSSEPLLFRTASAERMRIDSSGNVFIGSSSDSGTGYHRLSVDGFVRHKRDGDVVAVFDRDTSYGDLIYFRKDGGNVGSISVNSGYLGVGAGAVYLGYYTSGSTKSIIPMGNATGGAAVGAIDLGLTNANHKFKDLHLSGISYSAKNRIGTTAVINSSGEVLSVKSLSSGHSSFENNDAGNGTLYIENKETTANSYQPAIIIKSGGGNRGNIGVEYSTSTLGIAGHAGISLRTGNTSLNAATERLFISSTGNVGIGTSSPNSYTNQRVLTINGTTHSRIDLKLEEL